MTAASPGGRCTHLGPRLNYHGVTQVLREDGPWRPCLPARCRPRGRGAVLLGDHLTNAEIGKQLHISVRTVESHVSSLLRELGAADWRGWRRWPRAARVRNDAPVAGRPSSWTTFVGRARELAGLADALATDQLVTLLGPGGMGKTRLAAVAARGGRADVLRRAPSSIWCR